MPKPKTNLRVAPHASHEGATALMFRDDPELAVEYLNQVLTDGEREELLLALRYLASAFGGAAGVARATKLNARTLYRTLAEHGNPELATFTSRFKVMGLRLAAASLKPPRAKRLYAA